MGWFGLRVRSQLTNALALCGLSMYGRHIRTPPIPTALSTLTCVPLCRCNCTYRFLDDIEVRPWEGGTNQKTDREGSFDSVIYETGVSPIQKNHSPRRHGCLGSRRATEPNFHTPTNLLDPLSGLAQAPVQPRGQADALPYP